MRSGNSQAGRPGRTQGPGDVCPPCARTITTPAPSTAAIAAITRRTAIGAAGAGGVALLFAGIRGTTSGKLLDALGPEVAEAAAGTCTMTPAKTVGPYFVDEKLSRSDVRANTSDGAVQAGVPLTLTLQVFDADNSCAPVQGATVDIWHANASGLYSDESANGTAGQNWLRGYQTTDADGLVTFTTIYPGWYTGRAVHIHFKVRIYDGSTETLEFTSQLFFADAMNTSCSPPTARTRTARSRRRTPPTAPTASTAPTARRCCSRRPRPAAASPRTSPSASARPPRRSATTAPAGRVDRAARRVPARPRRRPPPQRPRPHPPPLRPTPRPPPATPPSAPR